MITLIFSFFQWVLHCWKKIKKRRDAVWKNAIFSREIYISQIQSTNVYFCFLTNLFVSISNVLISMIEFLNNTRMTDVSVSWSTPTTLVTLSICFFFVLWYFSLLFCFLNQPDDLLLQSTLTKHLNWLVCCIKAGCFVSSWFILFCAFDILPD